MTAPYRPTNESQRAIIAQLLDTDEDLRRVARNLVMKGLQDLNDIVHRGDPAIRASFARSLIAPITKAITEQGDEDANSDLRAEFHTMLEEMRGDIMDEREGEGAAEKRVRPKS